MRTVFADTFYWVALIDRHDDWHARVTTTGALLAGARILTTEEVLVEVLATFSGQGRALRRAAVRGVDRILEDANTEVLPQSHESFLSGLALYRNRPDKGYSLTDCISMQAMRERAVSEILTRDRHFQQEGFLLLLLG